MINVSDSYINSMKFEKNNIEHKYTVINKTRNLDLTGLLLNDTLKVSRFLRTANGSISPNTVDLKLLARGDAPNDIFLKDFHRMYKEFKNMRWKELINVEGIEEYLVRIGDLIVIEDIYNNEKITIFIGNVKEVVKTDSFSGREIAVKVDDNTIKGHEYFFSENISFENYYIYNSNDKEHSLLYILCTEYLEFDKEKLLIEDIKNENGEYIKIPLAKFEKNTKVMNEIADLVRSFYGNIYTMPDGSLRINSIFNKTYIQKLDITLGNKKNNHPVLYFIENTDIVSTQNKVEVQYSNIVANEKQVVFSLTGQNATKDDAKVIVRKKTVGQEYWKIDFNNIIEIEQRPIVKAYVIKNETEKEEVIYTDFELEFLNEHSARVKFNNSSDKDIYITKFEFLGKPISVYNNNTVTYTEHKNLSIKNTNLKSVNYKYIASKEQAISIAKHTFYNECRPYNKIKLRTNNMPFLELEDIIKLDYQKYKGEFQIIAINQTNMYTELILKEYKDYLANDENIITEKTNTEAFEGISNISKIEKEKYKTEISKLEEKLEKLLKRIEKLEKGGN